MNIAGIHTLPLTSLLILFSSVSLSAPLQLEVEGKETLLKTFHIHPQVEVTLSLSNYQVTVTDDKGKTLRLGTYEPGSRGKAYVLVDDFNFDGYKDIAVQQSEGYMGVNVFYDVFLYQPRKWTFKLGFHDSNIEADPTNQMINSGQRSGPRWYSNVYKVINGRPYIRQARSAMVGDGLDKVVFKNPKGKTLKTLILDTNIEDNPERPAVRTINAKRAYLHNKPNDNSKTRVYVIKGDRVNLHDYTHDVDSGEWFYVRYQGKKKLFKGWIKWNSIH